MTPILTPEGPNWPKIYVFLNQQVQRYNRCAISSNFAATKKITYDSSRVVYFHQWTCSENDQATIKVTLSTFNQRVVIRLCFKFARIQSINGCDMHFWSFKCRLLKSRDVTWPEIKRSTKESYHHASILQFEGNQSINGWDMHFWNFKCRFWGTRDVTSRDSH